jgi:pimeloyl-ACP methyl ester carboxylesterase
MVYHRPLAFARAADGTRLSYEEAGRGFPLLLIHEFAGDLASWEPQIRFFSRRYRVIAYNARGYPPSDVPDDPLAYSQMTAVDDAVAVCDAAQAPLAHVIGLSMGGFTALHHALRHPERTRSAVVAGAGYGAQPERQAAFQAESELIAQAFETEGAATVASRYALGPARVQLQNKDPRGWTEFHDRLAEHSELGAAMTMRGVQKARPSLYALTEALAGLAVPTLIITGDEDEGCLEPALMLKRTIPTAGLLVLPKTGHTCNLEEPALFNHTVAEFLAQVENDAWPARDPRSLATSTTGMTPEAQREAVEASRGAEG